MSSRKRALIWVNLDTHFREMIRIARILKSYGDYEPVLLFRGSYPVIEQDLTKAQAEAITCEIGRPPPERAQAWRAWLKGWGKRTRQALYALGRVLYHMVSPASPSEFQGLLRLALVYRSYQRQLQQARECIDHFKPSCLIFPEDNVEYGTSALIKAGHERGIPSVIVPYTLANALEPAEAYWDSHAHQGNTVLNRVVARFYPHWVYQHRGRALVRMPGEHALSQEWHGLAPPLPWILNSGAADVIAVESETVRNYYRAAGLPSEQLKVVGSPRLDDLARACLDRRRILDDLQLPSRKRIVLCALPPNQHPQQRPGCQFRSYDELVDFWISTLAALPDCNVLINLHPRVPFDSMRHLERCGVRLVRGDLTRLIPACDVFVASVSATISMAIACGKPVVNYDVYKYRYDDYRAVPGVLTIDDREAFAATLRRLVEDEPFLQATRARQAECKQQWGELDGKVGSRFLALLDQVISHRRVQMSRASVTALVGAR